MEGERRRRVGTARCSTFEAAATEVDVWVNDRKAGRHLGGWTPFRLDVTEALRAGADATNEIRVRLDE